MEEHVIPGGARLLIGDYVYTTIESASPVGYGLILPSPNSPLFREYYKKATDYAGLSTGLDRVARLLGFVHDSIMYDENFGNGMKYVPLYMALRDGKGVCKEKAALLYMILTLEGFDAKYVKGTLTDRDGAGGHAWVKIRIGKDEYLADPTNKKLFRYELAQEQGYKETSVNFTVRRLK
ncbi:MAG: transglutaminase-like domain-containing protein [Candidatus Micrarchaeaceae archaeon]